MAGEAIREWHRRLHTHFTELRKQHDSLNSGSPVFALDHGLDVDTDLKDLEEAVRETVASEQTPSPSWLPFIVYAAEIGYKYEGQEYWPEFERATPGWQQRGPVGRAYIKSKYELFALTYDGARPQGRWASQFTIIAWPITHAVLPVDLQKHLARLLYDCRRALTGDLLSNHRELGKWLEVRCGDTSSRFQQFAENRELLGLVAASLLGDEAETPLLSAGLLRRIVQDLNRERQSGTWLRNAKQAATRIRSRGFLGKSGSGRDRPRARASGSSEPKLELEFSLRQTPGGWAVYVTVPSFESLARRFPVIRDELGRRRCRVEGVQRVRARGALMYQQGPLLLNTMPASEQTSISVEGASEQLVSLMIDHCRFPSRPWLFRLKELGLAVEVRTKCIRPGQQYILVTDGSVPAVDATAMPEVAAVMSEVGMAIEGVHAFSFDVPEEIDDTWIAAMKQHGIGVVSDVVVWPAGLTPASWDGEGRAAWLAGEEPVIGIRSTRRIARCVILTAEDVAELEWPREDDHIFVKFTNLQVGAHSVDVHLFGCDNPKMKIVKGRFEISLLEPNSTLASTAARQAIRVRVHPARPAFDELWSGSAALSVSGPHGEKARFRVQLKTLGGRTTLDEKTCSSAMPVNEQRWQELLKGVQDSNFKFSADNAEEMHIEVSNPALGEATVIAERPFEPLRWVTGSDRDGPFARLIDHSDSEELTITKYGVDPLDGTPIEMPMAENNKFRSPEWILLVAHSGSFKSTVLLAPQVSGDRFESLAKLNVSPVLEAVDRSSDSIRQLVKTACLWVCFDISDSGLAAQQSNVNDAIVAYLSEIVTGNKWGRLEQDVMNGSLVPLDSGPQTGTSLPEEEVMRGNRILEYRVSEATDTSSEKIAAQSLLASAPQASRDLYERVDAFSCVLDSHGWAEAAELAEQILRLATAPGSIDLDDTRTDEAIETVLCSPAVLRLARCFVLALDDHHMNSDASLLEDWPWL